MLIGYDDPAVATKILRDFIKAEKRDEKMKITVGVLDGNLLQAEELLAVAQSAVESGAVLDAAFRYARAGPWRGLCAEWGIERARWSVGCNSGQEKGEGDMATAEGNYHRMNSSRPSRA